MYHKSAMALAVLLAALAPGGVAAAADAPAAASEAVWTTLGTAGGPVANASRSQPANLLAINGERWLVDCGDGAVERLSASGLQPAKISNVYISHLHLDHIGGLQGLIGLRWMTDAPGVLTVYGPPGTETLVAGIVQSMQPSASLVIGLRGGKPHPRPEDSVRVVILKDGSDLTVNGVRVRTVRNSHFDEKPGIPSQPGTESLSYRFDAGPDAVGYTGDTGVSPAVARLFKGVRLLVSEVIDLDGTIANVNGPHSPMTPDTRAGLIDHLKTQHLTPQQAGDLAAQAVARRLVLTHLAISGPTDAIAPTLLAGARQTFSGDVLVAHDLDNF
jgi:ribonuclease BN (tRNA processing enzyme)